MKILDAFHSAGGLVKDIITFPVRATISGHQQLVRETAKESERYGYRSASDRQLLGISALTPAFSTLVGGAVLCVGGADKWPLALGTGAGFQYAMDFMMATAGHVTPGFRFFPSLQKAPEHSPA